ncbi:MAG TPA: FHA domain-containing protein [Bryobacteraceae bacterium]|nr:FHA domain-containing protein [Bryobacteraceae bacterium]
MNFFSEVEKTIERTFRKWTERAFGPVQSDELLLVHRAILEQIESKIQTVQRGRRLFPYNYLRVRLISPEAERRDLFQAAFAQEHRLEGDIRECLQAAGCELPAGFAVEVETAVEGDKGFEIEYAIHEAPPAPAVPAAPEPEAAPKPEFTPGRLVVVSGKAAEETYALEKPRTNIGRMRELTDSQQRIVRRNDIVFEEGEDQANATVSRAHAHIRFESAAGEYRICDDDSEYGTRIFREGRSIEVPAGNRRGERLRAGDEIYCGRACLRFEA